MTTASSVQMGSDKSASQSFVINLASSTSPMALAHPSSPELKRYTFFVSRQREDGRERFRLHMGYFTTQEDAESLLAAVRDVYPAAWAGPAPTNGVARRGKISPVQLAPAVAHAASTTAPAPAPAIVAAPAAVVAPAPAPKPVEPELRVSSATTVVAQPEAPADLAALEQSMSSMRNALAQLAGDAPIAPIANPPTVQPMQPKQPVQRMEPPRLQPAVPVAQPLQPRPVMVAKPIAEPKPAVELTPVQALHVLEAAPVAAAPPVAPATPVKASALPALKSPFEVIEPTAEVPVVTPEDTQTLTDIKLDKQNNAPPCFAVQLVWSVSPIDVASLAHLAIFDAYTLYNVEGNRQGRKWYGLRLGFFSDPNSATQVAHYVRSDYRAVAVVPVANKERDRARGVVTTVSAMDLPAAPLQANEKLATHKDAMNGFELLTDDRPVPQKRDIEAPADAKANTATRAQVAKALGKAAPQIAPAKPGETVIASKGKRVVVRKRQVDAVIHAKNPGAAAVMESTLEILGASTLTLDDGRALVSDDALARKSGSSKKASNGKFSRLLSRLGGG
jgi:hypothetical protein